MKMASKNGKLPTIAVIGGGAAGLTAAIAAKRRAPFARVVIYERLPKVGKKLLATGDGRCNLTNRDMDLHHFHSENPTFAGKVLEQVPQETVLAFFRELGILFRTLENGKVYPRSMQASAVLDALRNEARRLAVDEYCEFAIAQVHPLKDGFRIVSADGRETRCARVILATGGQASPHLGSDGSGYGILTPLGHRTTPLFPALTQVKADMTDLRGLSGLRCDARVTTLKNGKAVQTETGEVLFTDYGLSGPCILQLSRMVSETVSQPACSVQVVFHIDFLPEMSLNETDRFLRERIKAFYERPAEEFFVGVLPKRIGQTILKKSGPQKLTAPMRCYTPGEVDRIIQNTKAFSVPVTGVLPFKNAQVTAGGLDTAQFDAQTLQSRLTPGIFACGEVLDVDGDCGGYNLQFAWSSGLLAGQAAARSLTAGAQTSL